MEERKEASDSEWEKSLQEILQQWDWDWSKHYPKRDVESWQNTVNDFLNEWEDVSYNFNEEDGVPGSRNSSELISFIKFCVKYPDTRFFQALQAWSRSVIYAKGVDGVLHDTYSWEERLNKESIDGSLGE